MLFQLLLTNPLVFLAWAIAFIIAITFHEFSHAFVAHRLGDDLARSEGRLSLNPLAHLDPIGTLLLIFVGFGWGRPVPFDPYALKNPRLGALLIALAGPVSNFLVALVFGLIFRLLTLAGLTPTPGVLSFFSIVVVLNISLMLFNLLPIPPLDGSKLLPVLLPQRLAKLGDALERLGPWFLFGIIILDGIVGLSLFARLYNFGLTLATRILGS